MTIQVQHLTNSLTLRGGGPSYSIPRLCAGLNTAGCRVRLACVETDIAESQQIFPTIDFKRMTHPAQMAVSPTMLRYLISGARNGEFDLLHSHNLWTSPSWFPSLVKLGFSIPFIVSPRGTLTSYSMGSGSSSKRLFWPLVQRPALHSAAAFHATAESEVEDLRRLGFRQPIAVIPNGIDVPDGKRNNSERETMVLFLGRLHPEKGLAMLLSAWARVESKFPKWSLKLVGPDSIGYQGELEAIIRGKGLKNVQFIGPVYDQAKYYWLTRAAVFVLPSPSENFGMSVAEALSVGTPVITNVGAPWSDVVKHGCGWSVDHGVDALVSALNAALSTSDEDRQAMGERGRLWMQSDLNWDILCERMFAFYRFVLKRGNKPSFVTLD